MDFIIIYCTVSSKKEGKKLARVLLENKFAACISVIDKVESMFSWDGEICEENEALMIIKTKKDLFDNVKHIIQKLHSYTVPEVISVPIAQADETYLKWIGHEVR